MQSTIPRPTARRGRNGFTLIELLVVVSIIALLVGILMPQLSRAKSIARMGICAHQLKQIGEAMPTGLDNANMHTSWPRKTEWPSIPMNVLPDVRVYTCPEAEDIKHVSLDDYCFHTNRDGGIDIPFVQNQNSGLCRVFEDNSEYTTYGFDDGFAPDLWGGSIDVQIKVTKTMPRIATKVSGSYQGWSGPPPGVLSLNFRGKPAPGWEDMRHVPQGTSIEISSGGTNYGINAQAGQPDPPPSTILLLDYVQRVANDGEDMPQNLRDSTRHLGRMNVLFCDQSVRQMGPTELDPQLIPETWTP